MMDLTEEALRELPAMEETLPRPATPMWFGTEEEKVFGLYHPPQGEQRDLAIVLCNPFGYEAMIAHRSYWHLAQALARRGLPVLRFHYHGTGDSMGDDRTPDRWAAWRRSICAASDQVIAASGSRWVGIFGQRLGANLALIAATERSDVRAVALWSPFATGQAFLREEMAVHKLRPLDPGAERLAAKADGEIEALGFAISRQTGIDIQEHRVADLPQTALRAALVLTRDTPLQEERVAVQLSEWGTFVTFASGEDYRGLMNADAVPHETWSKVVDFFVDNSAPAPAPANDGYATQAPPPPRAEVRLPEPSHLSHAGGGEVRETAGYFGHEQRLFGVLSQPATLSEPSEATALLLMSGGVNPHVGQNRMYTTWARRWAGSGVTCLRFDLAGFGDSGEALGGGDGKIHAAESVQDVRAAMDYVEETCGIRRFAIVGLCSGALQAFHTALVDDRISRLGLLNWTYLALDAPLESAGTLESSVHRIEAQHKFRSVRSYYRLAAAPSTWRRLVRGEVNVGSIAGHLTKQVARRLRSELEYGVQKWRGETVPNTNLGRGFHALAERGVQTCVVYNGGESTLDLFKQEVGAQLSALRRRGSLRLEVMDGADHVFTPLWSQEHVYELMTQHVVRPGAPTH